MKYIQLSDGRQAIVDDEDYAELSKYKWSYSSKEYAARNTKVDGKWTKVTMHRIVNNTPRGFETDHINRDKLDNRRSNLKTVTPTENRWNTGINANNTSGFRGVYWEKKASKWKAMCTSNRKQYWLGYFETAEEAAQAYIDFRLENGLTIGIIE